MKKTTLLEDKTEKIKVECSKSRRGNLVGGNLKFKI